MFPLLVPLLLACVALALQGHLVAWLVAPLVLLGIAAVIAQWDAHPDAQRDWIQGGFVDLVRDDAERLGWIDWEVLLTRAGEVDRRAGTFRIERRLLWGLIPLTAVEGDLREFSLVTASTGGSRHGGARLELRGAAGRKVLLLDLGHGGEHGPGRRLLVRLQSAVRAELERVRDAEAGRRPPQPPRGPADPPTPSLLAEDFAAAGAPGPRGEVRCPLSHLGGPPRVRRQHLDALARLLEGGRLIKTSRSRGWVSGRLEGRELTVSAWLGDAARELDLTRYALATRGSASLRVVHSSSPLARLSAASNLRASYHLADADDPSLMDDPSLTDALDELFGRLGFREVSVYGGVVNAEKAADGSDLCAGTLAAVFPLLERVALACERRGVLVAVGAPRPAGPSRCPFCRDDLRADEETLPCGGCGTVLHVECWRDLGRCPVVGCTGRAGLGRAPERPPQARARRRLP